MKRLSAGEILIRVKRLSRSLAGHASLIAV